MSKFKVGDKARVRKDLKVNKMYGGYLFSRPMKKYLGKLITIDFIVSDTIYRIKEDDLCYCWSDDMLEEVEQWEDSNNFTETLYIDGNKIEFKSSEIQLMTSQVKEEKTMKAKKILDIYFERKLKKLFDDMFAEKAKIIEKDNIYKLLEDVENQINVMLDRDEKNRYVISKFTLLPETEEKLDQLQKKYDLDSKKLVLIREEIEAQLAIIPEGENEYYDTIELLKTYEILDEDGKINQ